MQNASKRLLVLAMISMSFELAIAEHSGGPVRQPSSAPSGRQYAADDNVGASRGIAILDSEQVEEALRAYEDTVKEFNALQGVPEARPAGEIQSGSRPVGGFDSMPK